MGQKVNPYGIRLGINKTWRSKWFADPQKYVETLHSDLKIRRLLKVFPETKDVDIADVVIVRQPQFVSLIIYAASPGVVIGAKGANIERLSERLQKAIKQKIQIKIREVKRTEANAQLVALNIVRQLRMRFAFKRTLKMAAANAMRAGVQGIRIRIAGRLGGAEMSRVETHHQGRVPLHTLRAEIDYGFAEAHTSFGTIGVKVWICTGENFLQSSESSKPGAGKVLAQRRNAVGV